MSNMSYIRFENTLNDLEDCAEHIEDDGLSERENRSRRRMVQLMKQMVEDYETAFGEIEEY